MLPGTLLFITLFFRSLNEGSRLMNIIIHHPYCSGLLLALGHGVISPIRTF